MLYKQQLRLTKEYQQGGSVRSEGKAPTDQKAETVIKAVHTWSSGFVFRRQKLRLGASSFCRNSEQNFEARAHGGFEFWRPRALTFLCFSIVADCED